jgi:two-component system, NtrC family, sensor kinase
MAELPTLRRELVTALALTFAGALLVFAVGLVLLAGRAASSASPLQYGVLVIVVVGLVALVGQFLLERRVLRPIHDMVAQIETMAAGEYDRRLSASDTLEMTRLATAVNHMAERLISDQALLAANIQSLDDTNRALTEARDAMVRAEKMASVGRLGAGIAHEVGNPLGAILGYLGLLRRHASEGDREMVIAAEREVNRIDRIVRGLLDYARPREARSLAMSVDHVVHDTLELMETQGKFSGIELAVEIPESLPAAMGDPYQLQQVLVNLLVNAVDALAETTRPRIEVTARARPQERKRRFPARRQGDPPGIDYSHRRRFSRVSQPNVESAVAAAGSVIEVSIADNGPGIPEDMLDQIFEPFVTTKDPGKGTGLGLAVCARLIETMGGVVRATSAPGHGATFTVVLPAAPPDAPQANS